MTVHDELEIARLKKQVTQLQEVVEGFIRHFRSHYHKFSTPTSEYNGRDETDDAVGWIDTPNWLTEEMP